MAAQINKISGSTAVELISSLTKFNIKSISLANIHDSDSVTVDLYLSDASNSYYILKNVVIPKGVTMFLEDEFVEFERTVYSLYIKLGSGSSTVDVIIRN